MNRRPALNPSTRHRFPTEMIARAVWLDCRLRSSNPAVEELMTARGATASPRACAARR